MPTEGIADVLTLVAAAVSGAVFMNAEVEIGPGLMSLGVLRGLKTGGGGGKRD